MAEFPIFPTNFLFLTAFPKGPVFSVQDWQEGLPKSKAPILFQNWAKSTHFNVENCMSFICRTSHTHAHLHIDIGFHELSIFLSVFVSIYHWCGRAVQVQHMPPPAPMLLEQHDMIRCWAGCQYSPVVFSIGFVLTIGDTPVKAMFMGKIRFLIHWNMGYPWVPQFQTTPLIQLNGGNGKMWEIHLTPNGI